MPYVLSFVGPVGAVAVLLPSGPVLAAAHTKNLLGPYHFAILIDWVRLVVRTCPGKVRRCSTLG